jgi:hypothetical protein
MRYLLVFLISCAPLLAQAVATSQINGSVHDASGAAVPGAAITATQTETGATRTVSSGSDGGYVLTNLPIGPYRLDVARDGFATFEQTGIVLQVASNPNIDVSLKVGAVTEKVQVEANATMVETQSTGVGQVIENQRILELPLNGRNVMSLIMLAGGAVQTGTTSNRSFAGLPTISVAGGLDQGVGYFLDGAMHLDPYNGQAQPFPFPDALQEFKVETSGLSAQHSMGTSVNAVTKSGTNEFHGDAFEFLRNDLFNARNYFSTTHSTLKRNQFGGTVGGPIKKNKIFFFGGYQGTTIRQDAAATQAFVSTPAILSGDFTAFASPQCNAGRQITLKGPFVGNKLPLSLFDKAALQIAAKVPSSNNPCGLYIYGAPSPENDWQTVDRADYQINARHSLFARYIGTHSVITNPYSLNKNLLVTNIAGFDNFAQTFTLGETWLVGPTTVNSFRVAALRVAVTRVGAHFFNPSDVGINSYTYVPQFFVITMTGGFNIGGGTSADSAFKTTTYQLSDDVSMVRGAHQLSFGGNVANPRSFSLSNQQSTGTFAFNGQTTGLGMGDFFTGNLATLTQAGPIILNDTDLNFGLYGHDTWKLTSRLTANFGLRWEPFLPPTYTNSSVYNFDYGRFQQGIKSTVFSNAPAGLYYPGDPGFPGKQGINNRWADFEPRIGLAWDPMGDGKTSVRASFGMNYNFFPLQMRINSVLSPFSSSTTLTSPAGGLDNPWQGVNGGNPFPETVNKNAVFTPFGNFASIPYNMHPTYVETWNLALQRQIGSNWLATATYLGTHDVHIWLTTPVNNAQFLGLGPCTINTVNAAGAVVPTNYATCSTTANTNQRRILSLQRPLDGQYIGTLDSYDDGGTQGYNGMILSIQRRVNRGVTVNANYTWSHCIGDYSTSFGPNVGDSIPAPGLRHLNRGNCPGDRRQVFNITAVAQMPRFANHALNMVASGWQLSAIYSYQTGAYLAVLSGIDRALTGTATSGINAQRPDQVLQNPYGNGTVTDYLNPLAFAQPALGTIGNQQINNLAGPYYFDLDISLSRVFRIRERHSIEARAEAYNLTNSLRMGPPNLVLNSATFGQVNTASDPRILQFALKYAF